MTEKQLLKICYDTLLDLATLDGINAASKKEVYGCIFGRDSAITILKILKILSENPNLSFDKEKLLAICRRSLLFFKNLQGNKVTLESGEEPGKFMHEYRPKKKQYQHLLKLSPPWYVYPDGVYRNFDSIDATPLMLIAIYKFYSYTKDEEFLKQMLSSVVKALDWILQYADKDGDFLVEYEFSKKRKYGGLKVQSWTDYPPKVLEQTDGSFPKYPITPVEVQGYVWLALNLWADVFEKRGKEERSTLLRDRAKKMKKEFNKRFLFRDKGLYFGAQVLDGDKKQIPTVTGNPLLLFWATYEKNGKKTCILEEKYIAEIVRRAFFADMFDAHGGIRTMSSLSPTFDGSNHSYHNGSFWPVLNGMAHEGLMRWNYKKEAVRLRKASLEALLFFGTPIELYSRNKKGTYEEFVTNLGEKEATNVAGCRYQAWSAACALDLLTL